MNIGTIVTSGPKGQIVIPSKIREELHIYPHTPLQIILTGKSISIHPITGVARDIDTETSYLAILKTTQGAFGKETAAEKKQAKKRHEIEIKASEKRKNAW